MKVVLFCGGQGMRLREFSEAIPKPMVTVGYRPILWHVMKYYAHFGHTEFILCLGWKANVIKDYFLQYDECVSNDFVLTGGGSSIQLLNSDTHNWKITFVDTGTAANIGQRLKAVQPYLDDDATFLANYTDQLCDVPLPRLIELHERNQATATFLSVRPTQSFHHVGSAVDGRVESIAAIQDADVWMNAGYFVFNREIFHEMRSGDELVVEPFARLIQKQRLFTLQYSGFYACMDTFKEKQLLDEMVAAGETPWEVWRNKEITRHEEFPPRMNGRLTTRVLEAALSLPRAN